MASANSIKVSGIADRRADNGMREHHKEGQMKCPECKGKGGAVSWGDGWEEWDDCLCCGGRGSLSSEAFENYRALVAAEEARIDKEMKMKTPCKKCGVETWACECGAQWAATQ